MTKRFIQLSEVSEILDILGAGLALVRSGELPAIKVGGRGQWRVEASELESYIQRMYARPRPSSRPTRSARAPSSTHQTSSRAVGVLWRSRGRAPSTRSGPFLASRGGSAATCHRARAPARRWPIDWSGPQAGLSSTRASKGTSLRPVTFSGRRGRSAACSLSSRTSRPDGVDRSPWCDCRRHR